MSYFSRYSLATRSASHIPETKEGTMSNRERAIWIAVTTVLVVTIVFLFWQIRVQWQWIQHLQTTNEEQSEMLAAHNEALAAMQHNFDDSVPTLIQWAMGATGRILWLEHRIETLEDRTEGSTAPSSPNGPTHYFESYAVY